MPITLTESIIRSSDQPKTGWSPLLLIGFKEQVTNGKEVSIFEFECLGGPGNSDENKGRIVSHFLYHNALAIPDVVNELLRMLASFQECTIEEAKKEFAGKELNFGKLVNKKVYGDISDEVYQGKTLKKIRGWQPISTTPF